MYEPRHPDGSKKYPKSIITAIAEIRDNVGTVPKDGEMSHHNYQYVTERGLQGALRPLLKKHGLVIIQSCEPDQRLEVDNNGNFCFMAEFTICHTDGSVWPDKILVAAQDKGDKAPWKANTGALKYALNRLFMLDTGDDPEGKDDSAKSEVRTPAVPANDASAPVGRPQAAAPAAPASGRTLTRGHHLLNSQFWGMAFGASEKAHGKDDAMKWRACDQSVKQLGYTRLDAVPEDQFDQLKQMIESYPTWWNAPNAVGDEAAPPF